MLNDRQVAWMLRREFDMDENEGALVTERELLDQEVRGDNVPEILSDMDSLMLQLGRTDTAIASSRRECLFARQVMVVRSSDMRLIFS